LGGRDQEDCGLRSAGVKCETLPEKYLKQKRTWSVAYVVEHLLSKHETLNSSLIISTGTTPPIATLFLTWEEVIKPLVVNNPHGKY
jgi:hypothetical protein